MVKKINKIILMFLMMLLAIYLANESFLIEKRIPSSVQSGYGSGGIIKCEEYLKSKYGGEVKKLASKSLELIDIPQNNFKENVGNCAIVAITRIMDYYAKNGYINIETRDPYEFYDIVQEIAVKKHGYDKEKGGIRARDLKKILVDVLKYCNCDKVLCKQRITAWNFKRHIKKEIDAKRPVILCNFINGGWYGGHAMVVCGYKIYNIRKKVCGIFVNKKYPMIEVYDGWSNKVRYIDYRAYNKEIQRYGSTINFLKETHK